MDTEGFEKNRSHFGLRTLNDPKDPYLELVLVHGLLGDPELTWTFDHDKATFWPEWLMEEVDFFNTRIHNYGYRESVVGGRAPVSRLRDIGMSLCSALEVNTYVKRDAHVCATSSLSSRCGHLGLTKPRTRLYLSHTPWEVSSLNL